MTRSLGTLTIDLTARIGGFVDGLSKAEREAKKRADGISKSMKGVVTAAAALSAGVAAGTAALVKSQIDLADEYSKQSQILGIAIEDWSALNYATDLAGVSNDELTASITKLNKSITGSIDGAGSAADAFQVLGINVKDAGGELKDSYTVLNELADAFAGLEDGAAKTALAQELLGKSGAKLIPAMNGGAQGLADLTYEAKRLGQVIDAETGRAAEEFNDNLTRLQKVISGTGNQLANELVPSLAEFTDLINDEATQESIKAVVTGLADLTIGAVKLTSSIVGATEDLAEFFAVASHGPEMDDLPRINEEIDQISDLLNNRLATMVTNPLLPTRLAFANEEELISKLQALMKRRDEILDAVDIPDVSAPIAATATGDVRSQNTQEAEKKLGLLKQQQDETRALIDQQKEFDQAFSSQLESYQAQLSLVGDVTEAQKLQFTLEQGGLKEATDAQREQLKQMALMVDWQNEFNAAKADYLELGQQLRTPE